MERNKPSGARWWFGCVSALQLGFFVSACAPRMPHAAALEKPASSSSVVAPVVASLRDRALSTSRAYEWVTSLVDKVGPRLAGSRGEAAALLPREFLFRSAFSRLLYATGAALPFF